MQTIQVDDRKPIFSWCPNIEQGALDQMMELAKLPFVEHCALMPDAHLGMSMPIGGVLATNSVVIPNAVGVDIGCGLACFKTNLKLEDIKGKEELLHHAVERSIPMGFSHNNKKRVMEIEQKYQDKISYAFNKHLNGLDAPAIVAIEAFYAQMGTLGGGNHFLECQADEEDSIYFMVHSGSRNIGKKVCDHYNKVAEDLNNLWYSRTSIPFLPITSDEGKQYIGWMNMALQFAYYNRKVMLDEIWRNLVHYFPNIVNTTGMDAEMAIARTEGILNIHHNYAVIENHFGRNVWVHRKGATRASDQTVGIIPGSMGSFSYIVKGLGNKDSLNSCSHGAGRRMGRNDFNKAYNTVEKLKEIEDTMKGITHTKFGKAVSRKGKDLGMLDISEAPQAYKDIDEVMSNQQDLVTPIAKLRPIINWKDTGEE